ncbi:MAG TPA: hypothetical protein PK867_20995 [Pirellulales bacterium]|nr:hypothetical protein [Pirellulales bacterium]
MFERAFNLFHGAGDLVDEPKPRIVPEEADDILHAASRGRGFGGQRFFENQIDVFPPGPQSAPALIQRQEAMLLYP